jgi:putative copper resistance protein D
MSGLPAKEALAPDVLGTVLWQTQFGRLWLARMVACVALLGVLAAARGAGLLASGTALSALLLVALAGMGHGGSGRGLAGALHLGIDAAHLAAAGAWLGALVPLILVIRGAARGSEARRRFAVEATKRFSTLGVASMAVIVASGVANSCYMLPSVSALVATPYGRWLYLKIALFLVIFFIAATNRLQVTPRLSGAPQDAGPAFRDLTRNALAECGLGFAIVAIVGQLGVTVPGHTMQ